MKNIFCYLGFHDYKIISSFYNRCDNCETISSLCFPTGIKVLECKKCLAIKLKDNHCEVCGHRFDYVK